MRKFVIAGLLLAPMAAQATYIGGGLIGYTRRIAKRRLCHAETIPMFVCPERPSALG